MLVEKLTFIPKRGQQDKVVELIKKSEVFDPFKVSYRILVPSIGPFDIVVTELEFKDILEREKYWAGFLEKAPESFWKEWNDATENGGGTEVWLVAE